MTAAARRPGDEDRPAPPLHVVATAGHVDHGKSALILRLTGMDPDRLAEEKRRGLTIDLGFAWTVLPSGAEIGFVDVPGHERFVRNMLAGVGPVRLVLFVVAADEGWKPQSEEHLQIVDVLGCRGAVVALSKRDLVDDETAARRIDEVRGRLAGTALEAAPIVPCSAATGDHLHELRGALDDMVAAAPEPERDGRPRQFVDRVFTIRGAGTVVTGTLTGGPLAVGQEAEILPSGHRARIRGLQTHKRQLAVTRPVSRVAVNLVGTTKADLARGDVLAPAGTWRATSTFEGWVRPVRGLEHPLTGRGAYKVHAGSAERDARIHLYGVGALEAGGEAFARVHLSHPLVLDVGDGFVVREAGRRQTVAGGAVLDVAPPARPGPDPAGRLRPRLSSTRAELARLVVRDAGALRASDVAMRSGGSPEDAVALGALQLGQWVLDPARAEGLERAVRGSLAAYHEAHPLSPGMEVVELRATLADAEHLDPALIDALLDRAASTGKVARTGTTVRLREHELSTRGRPDVDRIVDAVAASEPTPPSVRELLDAGHAREAIRAAVADDRLVQVSPDVVVTPQLLARAEGILRHRGRPPGITVSAFREALGTSRRFALPILEHFDATGVTRRRGDVRILREA